MKPPTIEEVIGHIEQKKRDWPRKFISYYAEKFWNFYESNGWKVSGKAPMKNWQAAFNSTWQVLKFKEDIVLLEKLKPRTMGFDYPGKIASPVSPMNAEANQDAETRTIDFINHVYHGYQKHPTVIDQERLAALYDELKERRLIRLDGEQKRICMAMGQLKGKAQAVKFVFEQFTKEGKAKIA